MKMTPFYEEEALSFQAKTIKKTVPLSEAKVAQNIILELKKTKKHKKKYKKYRFLTALTFGLIPKIKAKKKKYKNLMKGIK